MMFTGSDDDISGVGGTLSPGALRLIEAKLECSAPVVPRDPWHRLLREPTEWDYDYVKPKHNPEGWPEADFNSNWWMP
jgi:hypothetical protein